MEWTKLVWRAFWLRILALRFMFKLLLWIANLFYSSIRPFLELIIYDLLRSCSVCIPILGLRTPWLNCKFLLTPFTILRRSSLFWGSTIIRLLLGAFADVDLACFPELIIFILKFSYWAKVKTLVFCWFLRSSSVSSASSLKLATQSSSPLSSALAPPVPATYFLLPWFCRDGLIPPMAKRAALFLLISVLSILLLNWEVVLIIGVINPTFIIYEAY